MPVQIAYPQIGVTFDVNLEQAISTRIKIFDYIATNKIPVGGSHFSHTGMGIIIKTQDGNYEFIKMEIVQSKHNLGTE